MDMSQEQAPTLSEVLERLEALIDWEQRDRAPADRGQAMRVDLEPVTDLLSLLGRPDLCLCYVHVAGTKGKGSVASLVAAGLKSAGLRVGRFASPHVERLNERVLIDGEEVPDEQLAARRRVGVITPYAQQLSLLKRLFERALGPRWAAEVDVNTVDGFQGREKDIILFSCVRSAGNAWPEAMRASSVSCSSWFSRSRSASRLTVEPSAKSSSRTHPTSPLAITSSTASVGARLP